MEQKERKQILPDGRPFKLHCRVEQNDQLIADLFGEYGDMVYDRKRQGIQTIISIAVCLVLIVVILMSKVMIPQAAWAPAVFAGMYLLYGIYYQKRGYRNNYVQFQQHIEKTLEKGHQIYPDQTVLYDFQDHAVYIEYPETGNTRYFLYEDIRYIEPLRQSYLIGLKYLPKEARLFDLERVLIPKRDLTQAQEEHLLQIFQNLQEAYDLKEVLAEHPFR